MAGCEDKRIVQLKVNRDEDDQWPDDDDKLPMCKGYFKYDSNKSKVWSNKLTCSGHKRKYTVYFDIHMNTL